MLFFKCGKSLGVEADMYCAFAAYTVQLIFKPEPDPEAAVLDVPEVLEDVSDRGHDGH